jgi:hypothetical protein
VRCMIATIRCVCAGEPSWWDGSAYLWDNGISAVTTDAFGVEVWPPDVSPAAQPFGLFHRILIGQLGLAPGRTSGSRCPRR